MIRILLFISICNLLTTITSFGQKKNSQLDKTTSPQYHITNCFKKQKYTEQERLKLYPFNEAAKMEVVTFAGGYSITNPKTNIDSIDYNSFSHIKRLSAAEISELSDIIFNIDYTFVKVPRNVRYIDHPTCYNPHHALILTDDKGNHFAWIEVCFGCKSWRTKGFKLGYNCDLRFQLFEDWFKKTGEYREGS